MSGLKEGSEFEIKSDDTKDKGTVRFTLVKATEKTADLKYTVNGKTVTVTLDLVEKNNVRLDRLKKAYVRDGGKNNNNMQPEEQVKPSSKGRSRRR